MGDYTQLHFEAVIKEEFRSSFNLLNDIDYIQKVWPNFWHAILANVSPPSKSVFLTNTRASNIPLMAAEGYHSDENPHYSFSEDTGVFKVHCMSKSEALIMTWVCEVMPEIIKHPCTVQISNLNLESSISVEPYTSLF